MTTADQSARLSLAFSCVGHLVSHLFAPIFFVVALALEENLSLSHGEVVALILAGNVLFGVCAPVAGWLGDRWNASTMIALFFLGTGGGMVATGFASGPVQIALALAATGMFASIYHPVGIAWLVRNAAARGLALGINGVFGGIGPAVAALSAGVLTHLISWRAAFIVPGLLVIGVGIAFTRLVASGRIVERRDDRTPLPAASRQDALRALAVLSVTMLCTGLIYQATQPALPKLFASRLDAMLSEGVLGVSFVVAAVYVVSGGLQILAGHLADRYPLRAVYLSCFMLQVPVLIMAGAVAGPTLVGIAMLMVSLNAAALPAENSLVARYAPARRRGLAFGLKFILAFGVSGLGVGLEGMIYELTGGFWWLFVVLASIAAVAAAAAALLPQDRPAATSVAAEAAR